MPTGQRKQRYLLDVDDLLKRGFLTQENADELIAGLNESGTTGNLAVEVGGTNNRTYVDQKFLIWDEDTNSIKSSTITSPPAEETSILIPYETGAIFANATINPVTSGVATNIVSQSFTLPADSQWVELFLAYNFKVIETSNPSATGLGVYIGDAVSVIPGVVAAYGGSYASASVHDAQAVTWIAMGPIPSANRFDTTLTIKLRYIPFDHISSRSCIMRMSYRGTVIVPPPVVHGTFVFLEQTELTPGVAVDGYYTANITASVPTGISRVLLYGEVVGNEDSASLASAGRIWVRAETTSTFRHILATAHGGNEDKSLAGSQGIFPIKSTDAERSFQWKPEGDAVDYKVYLVGYIT